MCQVKENAAAGPVFVTENAAIYSLFNNCIFILSCPYNLASPSSCVGFDFAPHYMAVPLYFCRLNCLISVRPWFAPLDTARADESWRIECSQGHSLSKPKSAQRCIITLSFSFHSSIPSHFPPCREWERELELVLHFWLGPNQLCKQRGCQGQAPVCAPYLPPSSPR